MTDQRIKHAEPYNPASMTSAAWLRRQSKTGEILEIPLHRNLEQWIDAASQLSNRKGTTIVIGHRGRPFTEAGFRSRFFKVIRHLEQSKKIGNGLTFHGLRHTVGTKLADAGADDFMIQSILGQKTATMAQRYRRGANKKRGVKRRNTVAGTAHKKEQKMIILENNNGKFGKQFIFHNKNPRKPQCFQGFEW